MNSVSDGNLEKKAAVDRSESSPVRDEMQTVRKRGWPKGVPRRPKAPPLREKVLSSSLKWRTKRGRGRRRTVKVSLCSFLAHLTGS